MREYDGVPWAQWLVQHYPEYFISPDGDVHFSNFHQEFWEWVWSIGESRPQPFVGIVFRFGGKSTNVEAAVTYLGAESLRRYCLYVSGTQTQADDHVSSIGEMLRSPAMAAAYPLMGEKMVNQFNQSMGWRVNRLRTAHGFTVDAVGLDKAMRGAKLGNQRPDIIAFDDIDATHDSARTVEKKIETLTRSIFPAGANNVVILGVQNLVQHNGIFAKLARGEVDFMADKFLSGPWPAIDGAVWETDLEGVTILTTGTPTWSGMDLAACQDIIDDIGLKAWRVECQHETDQAAGVYLVDIWNQSRHVVEPFQIPDSWRIDRSYDWGFSKPWAEIFWAEADGVTPIHLHGRDNVVVPKGTLFAIAECYGSTGKPDEGDRKESEDQAVTMAAFQRNAPWGSRVEAGPADNMIFNAIDGQSISARMIAAASLRWTKSVKGAGSRVAGANAIVGRLRASLAHPMERPGLYIWNTCPNIIRTWSTLPTDAKKPDDVDTTAEDHLWDAGRYRCLDRPNEVSTVELYL
tara:strand:+ start:1735 stop:3291 length:1557 start_codon:yes stop_codon:yes gene_type:complete